ncbi:T9SS type A sorting domain-containing protein [Psychroserpens ponticola]|uniref:T9SS type A sorting domain-containing protein n=1 Tax=Psychroserpens ponticola TaxID=2932268 RepID=A0ABY7RWS7_9FLAO|nr:T9SS type A sorting domain-containing protein [Psychroserpens ponticola]WCO01542.1 T9SS type A sorting domain-containing protein [Psychroserpens ponticola]
MKRILFFMTLFCVSLTAFAQNEFTGYGDGYSWEDPDNWSYFDVPQNGDDILIDGQFVYYEGSSFYQYGSLELRNFSNLFVQGDIELLYDFTVDVTSTVELYINEIDVYTKIRCYGNYYFNGEMVIYMSGYGPQIGDSFNIIEGSQGSCGTATTLFVPENQASGIEVDFGVQCEADGIYYTVTGINYSTAKSWDGEGGDGQWNNAANWDPNGVPVANDIIYINMPGSGSIAYTNGAGVTHVKEIIVGKNNTLVINGDFSVEDGMHNNIGGTIIWNAGKILKEDINRQCLLINYGNLILDSSGLKEMEDDFEIWAFRTNIDHNQGNLNINNGKIVIFNYVNYNINADNITIGYTSGTNHSFDIRGVNGITKTSGSGTSTINLTDLYNNADIISEMGTLAFTEDVIQGTYSNFGGSGTLQFPTSFEVNSDVSPGSSPGTLTIAGDFIAGSDTVFNIEIDGPTVDTGYDRLVIQDNADISGNINVILGYLPPNNAVFEILSAASLNTNSLPETIEAEFEGNFITFSVEIEDDSIYLVGPGATLSVENVMTSEALSVYPNPAKNILNIKTEDVIDGKWRLINQLGQVVNEGYMTSTDTMININTLLSGVYFLNINDQFSNQTIIRKVIISN